MTTTITKMTGQDIGTQAKKLGTAAQQKRFINAQFRKQTDKKGLPVWGNDFCVASRAITRVNVHMRDVKKDFHPISYARDVEVQIRMVIQDAWKV
jgi:hypothetical protein